MFNDLNEMISILETILLVFIMVFITYNILFIPYKIYKKVTGKTIGWVEHGIGNSGNKESQDTIEIKEDKIYYLGIKSEKCTNYKLSTGVGMLSTKLYGTMGMLSPVSYTEDVMYFKYKKDILRIESNPELYFIVKDLRYKDKLNCKVKCTTKSGKLISQSIVSIEGVNIGRG